VDWKIWEEGGAKLQEITEGIVRELLNPTAKTVSTFQGLTTRLAKLVPFNVLGHGKFGRRSARQWEPREAGWGIGS